MKETILVSIITVCYNSSKTIADTIRSVLHQTYADIEYIVVDGRSTDGTLDIVRRYEGDFGGRIRIISEEDQGIYDAMNKGIRCARGTLIGIINSDDYYEPDAVEKIVASMTGSKYQILYGAIRAFQNETEDVISIYSHHFLRQRSIGHPACFITKALYEDLGTYDTKYTYVADYDFMLRMDQEEAVEFIPVYALIANCREGGASASGAAYMDLVRLQRDYGIITKWKYYKIRIRSLIG